MPETYLVRMGYSEKELEDYIRVIRAARRKGL